MESYNPNRPDPATIRERHQKAMLMLVEGAKPSQVAKEVGISETRVYQLLKSPKFRAEMMQSTENITFAGIVRLRQNFNKAVDVLVQTLEDPNPKLRFDAAKEYTKIILDTRIMETENAELRDHISKMYAIMKNLDPEAKRKAIEEYETMSNDQTVSVLGLESGVEIIEGNEEWEVEIDPSEIVRD